MGVVRPAMEPMLTMRPQPRAIMSGAAARQHSQAPVRLTSMTRRHSVELHADGRLVMSVKMLIAAGRA